MLRKVAKLMSQYAGELWQSQSHCKRKSDRKVYLSEKETAPTSNYGRSVDAKVNEDSRWPRRVKCATEVIEKFEEHRLLLAGEL